MKNKHDIKKICALCEYATPIIDEKHENLYMCAKKGFKHETDSCAHFKYNLLAREVHRRKLDEIEVVEV